VLEAVGLRHRFGTRTALDGVDLVVRPGVVTGLLGPNGAGKTTLLRVLLGILEPADGQVLQDGRPVRVEDRRRWGYAPQDRALYPAMRAGDQLVHLARLRGLDRATAARRARILLDAVDLADRWDERTDRLSGGQQQRLQLAGALVHEPDVLVLDEPFAGLDPTAVDDLAAVLDEQTAQGRTVLLSSHQLDLVQDRCNEIVLVDHGRVVLAGSVANVRASEGGRQLRLGLAPDVGTGWLSAFPGVSVVEDLADGLRLALPPGTAPLAVLDAARAAGTVTDFGLDLPTLSQVFRRAVGAGAEGMSAAGRSL
jgi:ABC-2 type transport system ATP-binding protein